MEKGCALCPRKCGADRASGQGLCGADDKIRIARVGLHEWEEPCISYGKGSGTVFFSGCSLSCVFCQNYEISQCGKGRDVTLPELCDIFLSVSEMGAANLNLVNPTHYVRDVATALERVKDRLGIPVVYNSGGYDNPESLKMLEGLVDIYLPDLKYKNSEYSAKYSDAPDYFEVATGAIAEMLRQTGYPSFSKDGHLLKGTLIRHLVLPGLSRDSMEILKYLASAYDTERLYISIMSQYFPTYRAGDFPELSRRLTTMEYQRVIRCAEELGIVNGFLQERESAIEDYVPTFDF